jgi:diguanylate cyclase (GGDEF)-like protein/PAS domain S-box-containing protein
MKADAARPVDKTKVLLVDDLPANLLSYEVLLDEFDATLLRASSGNEALHMLLQHQVALVLLDVQMPGMDGFEVAELMQKSKRTQGIPIIFVTAIGHDNRHVIKGYQNGAVDFLFKPIDPVVLKSKVRVFLEMDRKNREIERGIRALQASLRELHSLKEHNELLLLSVGEGILSLNTDGCIQYANPTAVALLDGGGPLLGSPLSEHLAVEATEEPVVEMLSQCMEGESWHGTIRAKRRDETFPAEITATAILREDGHFAGVSVVFKDVTNREKLEQKLKAESERDPLTGLVNRRGFERRLDQRLSQGRNDLALLFIDLDHFKEVNDRFGHQAGDALLKHVAQRLQGCTRSDDIVARLGGDEFCIVVQAALPQHAAGVVGQKVLDITAHPIKLGEDQAQIGASIGVVLVDPSLTLTHILHQADVRSGPGILDSVISGEPGHNAGPERLANRSSTC